jgi:2EXR family
MEPSNNSAVVQPPKTLLQDGENLALVNPEFFLMEERLRMKIRADKEAASRIPDIIMWQPRFVCFKELPTELRRIIWNLVAREPRIVEFSYYPKQKTMESKFPSKTMVPAILHTSSEARTVGLEVYEELNFGFFFDTTYINWEVDIVTFENINALKAFLDIEDGIYAAADPRRPRSAPIAIRPAKSTQRLTHSPINLYCRRLAINSKNPWVDLSVSLISPRSSSSPNWPSSSWHDAPKNPEPSTRATLHSLPALGTGPELCA